MKAYSAIENESLLELFELNKFDSQQSIAYKDSIQTIINANVKICFIASINDQLVPLFSALASHISIPIYTVLATLTTLHIHPNLWEN